MKSKMQLSDGGGGGENERCERNSRLAQVVVTGEGEGIKGGILVPKLKLFNLNVAIQIYTTARFVTSQRVRKPFLCVSVCCTHRS